MCENTRLSGFGRSWKAGRWWIGRGRWASLGACIAEILMGILLSELVLIVRLADS